MEQRNGEMAILPIESDLLAEMLRRERSMLAGSRTADQSRMRTMTEVMLDDDPKAL